MSLKQRIYEDYLKKSRLPAYRRTLQVAKLHGYQMVGILDFTRIVRRGNLSGKKIYINRHDIDTSPKVAAEMFEIEKEIYGRTGTATYYFRNSTIDKKLINVIDAYGYETGYHYEELATFTKENKLRSKEEIVSHINEAGEVFLNGLKRFRDITGSSSVTIASHGDFINTRYDIQSYEMLKNQFIREKAGIEVEAYDDEIMHYVQERFADQQLLDNYPEVVINAFEHEIPVVMTLTHPRNWEIDVLANTIENFRRIIQDLRYRK